MFDRLLSVFKDRLEARRTHGVLADGTQISFYGLVSLELKLKGDRIPEVFVVGPISKDVILGMPFLSDRKCTKTFGVPILNIDGKEYRCTDRHGRHLVNDVQVVRRTTLPRLTTSDTGQSDLSELLPSRGSREYSRTPPSSYKPECTSKERQDDLGPLYEPRKIPSDYQPRRSRRKVLST